MALITKDNIKKLDKDRNSVHNKVRATYTTFTSDGKKYFQIDTYGSPTREIKDTTASPKTKDYGALTIAIKVFEDFYNKYSSKIIDNVITLSEEETKDLISMMYLWDGKINDMVPETKAVENKQIWEVVSDGKER
mgnify:CR=1 FL=1